ncbi:SMEK domain-containing protein [Clostridium sporogenes]|uniref:SMEK domain-containing protein n=1 Tax=Clostridium sporogenes TaxID=1509 RepID=UPI002238E00F|nr:SMEK domain-containing protein [Clostridium sporogenes]MCW6077500.1 SMEK domain-containing protein [Clostridium sporogenes]
MREMTIEYIKDEDITIDSIKRRLCEVALGIKKNNKINLTDINVICEEIFGKILNEIFDINLVSMSAEVSGNFIAVDLIDYDKKVAFQVTSRSDREKIENTIEKFNKSDISKQIDRLNILILDDQEHTYYKPEKTTLVNNNEFSFKDNIYNFRKITDLIRERNERENGFIIKIYDDINMVFDSGRIKYFSIVKNTELLTSDVHYESDETAIWKHGYGDIQLTAFIPLTYEKKISCLLEFRQHDIAAAYITFDQERLLQDYFVEEDEFKRKHNVGRYVDEEMLYMQIENVRFNINAHTGYHIFQLFSELKDQYFESKKLIDKKLGTEAIRKIEDKYCLMTINEQQWNEILFFARKHDWFSDDGEYEWNIFNNNWSNDSLILSPNVHSEIRGDILAKISVDYSRENISMLDVFWEPGFKFDKRSMEGFDNVVKWKADYTLDWMKNKLLPEAQEFYKNNNYNNNSNMSLWKRVFGKI